MMEVRSAHLKKVLKSYQLSAVRSLEGPGRSGGEEGAGGPGIGSPPPQAPLARHPPPILTPRDRGGSCRSLTLLEGEPISCFQVGGEQRLCLPQILNSVLRDFALHQINQVCAEKQIFCSRCGPEQLDELKSCGILPISAPSCGLITKTDAERLCAALVHRPKPPPPSNPPTSAFLVYHECFGKARALCRPDLYTGPASPCLQCLECRGLFSPPHFVSHAHAAFENRTCHWGFDSENWRCYLHLCPDQPDLHRRQALLDLFKRTQFHTPKRKQVVEEEEVVKKWSRLGEGGYWSGYCDAYAYAAAYSWATCEPWPPFTTYLKEKQDSVPSYLSRGPPVLLHPEKVVPLSQTEQFESSYQPNVALAPPNHKQLKSEGEKEELLSEEVEVEEEALSEATNPTEDSSPSGTIVEEVSAVFEALTDTKETTRQLVIGVVNKLAVALTSLQHENRRLRNENSQLKKHKLSQEKAEGEERGGGEEQGGGEERSGGEEGEEKAETKDEVAPKKEKESPNEERVVLSSPVSVITSPLSLSMKSEPISTPDHKHSPPLSLSPSDLFFFKG